MKTEEGKRGEDALEIFGVDLDSVGVWIGEVTMVEMKMIMMR